MAHITTHTEDRLAAELARDAEIALLNGHPTVEGFRAEKHRYFRCDQPIGDAIYEVTGEDDCRQVITEALLAACKTNDKLRRTLADAIGKANALGVMFVRGWDVDEAA
jgi:predicted transcriptional regulator